MSTQTYTDFRGRPSNNVNPGAINPGWSIRGTPKTVIIDDGNATLNQTHPKPYWCGVDIQATTQKHVTDKLWLVLMCKVCIVRTWVVQKCCPSIRRQQGSLQFFITHIFWRNNGCVSPHCGFSRLFWCQALPLCHPLILQCHSARITTICGYGSNPWYSAEHLMANRCSTLKCGKLNAISRPQ